MKSTKQIIPIFFSCDDNYLPFAAVALRSLIDNASADAEYRITILHDGLKAENVEKIKRLETENAKIGFTNVSEKIKPLMNRLSLRDYYTMSIYFRIFIPAMFTEYDKAVYLDADIAVMGDISKMFNIELGENLLGAVPDAVIASDMTYITYAEYAVGVKYEKYFNSGVLLMNLKGMRDFDVEGKFAYLLNTYNFNTICPDQDYLNAICRDRVLYIDEGWNKMSLNRNYPGVPSLVHYNMFNKPWLYSNVPYEEYFWKYAEGCGFYDEICKTRRSFGLAGRMKNIIANRNLLDRATEIAQQDCNFRCVLSGKEIEVYETDSVAVAGQA